MEIKYLLLRVTGVRGAIVSNPQLVLALLLEGGV